MTTFSIQNGRVFSDNTGASMSMRVLTGPDGALRPLIDYFLNKRRSRSWQEKLLRAVKLFLEYLEANLSLGQDETQVFCNFRNALSLGTIDHETGDDPSGLFWTPIGAVQANYMISQLSDFFDWLGPIEEDLPAGHLVRTANFNPRYVGNAYDRRVDRQAYLYRRNKAFLGHTWSMGERTIGRRNRGERAPKVYASRPPMFPEDRFEELLFKGFRVAGKYDYRGMLITLLQFGGGLRVSETFHLYVADVQPHWSNLGNAFVVIHHPSLGIAPNHWRNSAGNRGSRREYLATKFGLVPRNEYGKAFAGWKQPALDAHWYLQVHWFPEVYGQWFMQIWERYMEQIAVIRRSHPFAWINIEGDPVGDMYQIRKYQAALRAAVERIGLISCKAEGTTPHGFRHAYGQRARKAGIDKLILQRLMHHSSIESQEVYTQPEANEAEAAIRQATEQLRQNNSQLPMPIVSTTAFMR